jgi:PIN domain nuclease of toxin-antitoxin system
VNLLLDSHTLLWALTEPTRLRTEAAEIIVDPATLVWYSAATVWELELKATLGKLSLPVDWLDAVAATRFDELPISAADARESVGLPWHHRDPFDRVLIAQARLRGLRLATRDPVMARYDVPLLAI